MTIKNVYLFYMSRRNSMSLLRSRQRSRYNTNRTRRIPSVRRRFNSIKSKMQKNNISFKSRQSDRKFKEYKQEITKMKDKLDSLKDEVYKFNNISKNNLNISWNKALRNYRKKNYSEASKYFVLCLLTGLVLLDRHGTYRKTYNTKTTIDYGNINELLCGLLDYSKINRDTNFNHKTVSKAQSNKVTGPINYFTTLMKSESILDGELSDDSAGKIFDFVYNCKNPYVKKMASTLYNR